MPKPPDAFEPWNQLELELFTEYVGPPLEIRAEGTILWTIRQYQIFHEILNERDRQETKWHEAPGVWPCDATTKLAVLAEEFGEVARGVLERDAENVREELVQVAAVCMKWLEAFDADQITNRRKDGAG